MKLLSSKSPFLLVFCLVFSATWAEDLPPLPEQKLPVDLPKFAAWEISIEHIGPEDIPPPISQAGAAPATAGKLARPEKIVVTRTNDFIREEISWSDDTKTQKWVYLKNLQVFEESATGKLYRVPTTSLAGNFSDYSKGDFTEIAWIGPQNYKGVRDVGGRSSFIFSTAPGSVVSAEEEHLHSNLPTELRGSIGNTRELHAAIDTKTLLPVWFSDGSMTKTYRILEPPTTALEMPSAFAKEFEDWVNRIRQANRVPGPP